VQRGHTLGIDRGTRALGSKSGLMIAMMAAARLAAKVSAHDAPRLRFEDVKIEIERIDKAVMTAS
jgi:hypothetical protein